MSRMEAVPVLLVGLSMRLGELLETGLKPDFSIVAAETVDKAVDILCRRQIYAVICKIDDTWNGGIVLNERMRAVGCKAGIIFMGSSLTDVQRAYIERHKIAYFQIPFMTAHLPALLKELQPD